MNNIDSQFVTDVDAQPEEPQQGVVQVVGRGGRVHGQGKFLDLVSSDEDVPQDDEESPMRLPRPNPAAFAPRGGKRPRMMYPHNQEDEDVLDQPDLAEYFQEWEIPDKDVILMCRAYASYLSAKKRPFARK